MEILTFLGVIAVIWVFVRFVKQLGQGIPILELMLLIAGLQWIIGPVIEYNSGLNHFRYYMYVPESVYMGYIVPAYLVFTGIIFLTSKRFSAFRFPVENLV